MSGKRTAGFLRLASVENDSGRIVKLVPVDSADQSLLTVVESDGVTFAAVFIDADARRLVACWNACDGLGTDLLENIQTVGDTLKSRFAQRDAAEARLTAQRDELLQMLRRLDVEAGVDGHGGPLEDGESQLFDAVRALITKTEEAL